MDILSYVIGKSAGEAAAHVDIEQLDVTENNTYTAQSGHAYSPVVVNVPQTTIEALNVTSDGTYTAPEGKAYSPISVSVDDFDLPSFLAGTMTSIESGTTSIRTNAFNGYSYLQSASFPNATSLGDYAFQSCTGLTSINIPSVKTIGNHCFSTCSKIPAITLHNLTSVGQYAFYNMYSLSSVDIILNGNLGSYAFSSSSNITSCSLKINGQIGSNAFSSVSKMTSFQLDPSSNVTDLGDYAFYYMGSSRNPSTAVITLDFRNSRFKTVSSSAFQNLKYMVIYLPNTVNTLKSSAFSSYQNSLVYFTSQVPPTVENSNCFNYWSNSKLLAPYNVVNKYKTTTNYTSISSSIFGYAPAGTFTEGEQLPLYDEDGYSLTWYSDIALTAVITDCPVGSPELYCTIGSKIMNVVSGFVDTNTTFSIVDTEGDTYIALPAFIPSNRGVTINAAPPVGGMNVTRVDGTTVTTPHTIASLDSDIAVQSKSIDTIITQDTFENSSWEIISKANYLDIADQYWNIGDTKSITLTNNDTYKVRIANIAGDLYEYSDRSDTTGFVVEFENCYNTKYSYTNDKAWQTSPMRLTVLPSIYELFPSDLKQVIPSVRVAAINDYRPSTAEVKYTDDSLFLLSIFEIVDSGSDTPSKEKQAVTKLQYYTQYNTAADRIKRVNGTASDWGTRSHTYSYGSNYCAIMSSGSCGQIIGSQTTGVSPAFCIKKG